MHLTALDDAAWTSPWRHRAVSDKTLLSLGLVLTALLSAPVPGGILVAAASVACLLGPARLPARLLVGAMTPPAVFIAIGSLSVAVSVGAPVADAWWSFGPLSIGTASLARAGGLLVHAVAGTLAILVLATTTPMVDLLTSARALRIPNACLEVSSLIYRLLFVLLDTAHTVREAQQARLGDCPARRPDLGFRGRPAMLRIEAAGSAAGTVLVRSWARAERLTDGLTGRGYDDALFTLPVKRPRSARFEVATVVVIGAIWAAGIAWAQLTGGSVVRSMW
ncbi:MAG: cobalt ECF transporter T component CbiQ [Dermatophilaceae bacterium]